MSQGRRVYPRRPLHVGVVEAGGVLLGAGLRAPEAQARRALALWEPGVLIYSIDVGLLVRFRGARRLDARRAVGLALVWREGALSSAPLSEEEWAALEPGRDSAVIVEGGEARVYRLAGQRPVEPAAWLDVGEWEVARVSALAPAPAPPKELAPKARPMRGALGLEPEAAVDVRREAVILALRGERPALPGPQGAAQPQGEAAPPWWAQLGRWLQAPPRGADALGVGAPSAGASTTALARAPQGASGGLGFLGRLGRWVGEALGGGEGGARPPRPPSQPTQGDRAPVTVEQAPPEGWLGRLQAWARAQGERAQREQDLGAAQARYVEEMMEMFRRGQLHDALRRAIPLADEAAPPGAQPAQVGGLAPRAELQISQRGEAGGARPRSALGVYEELRRLYRASFEALAQEGRVEEAAYVLIELLGQDQEGIRFLEAQGRFRMAAEVAEARKKDPAQVVRLWVLAGEEAQALRLARKHAAFEAAELLLKDKDGEAWRRWRVAWAEQLAQAGDLAQAVEVAWPIEEARPRGLAWLDRLVEVGGAAGGKALARRMVLAPGRGAEDLALARAWVEEGEVGEARREGFVGALVGLPHDEGRQRLARRAARRLWAEHHQGQAPAKHELASKLVYYCGDPSLQMEFIRAPKAPEPRTDLSKPLRVEVGAADVGVYAVRDVLRGLDGRFLLALGEAGALLCESDGRVAARFAEPTHRLVGAGGLGAVGLAPRDKLWRLTRFDLERREARPWCHAPLDAWASDSDGGAWYVAQGQRLLALDLAHPGEQLSVLWEPPALGGQVRAVSWTPGRCALLVSQGYEWEFWSFQAHAMLLDRRSKVALPPAPPRAVAHEEEQAAVSACLVSESGVAMARRHELARFVPAQGNPRLAREVVRRWERGLVWRSGEQAARPVGEEQAQAWPLAQGGIWTVFAEALPDQAGLRVCVVDYTRAAPPLVAEVILDGAQRACARFEGERLLVADDRGRVLWLDVARRALLGQFRA